jgi:carboxymethylenebutenolidase
MLHLTTDVLKTADYSNQSTTKHFYPTSSTYFVLPKTAQYDPASASLAHSRTLVFLRKNLGGPLFDLEAIWDEHTYFEFEVRSVAKTMGTMVVSVFVDLVLRLIRVTLLRLNHMSIIFLLLRLIIDAQ